MYPISISVSTFHQFPNNKLDLGYVLSSWPKGFVWYRLLPLGTAHERPVVEFVLN
jgi:hypothetical protein